MQSQILPVNKPVIVLVGPTAIGKTELSLSIAKQFNCEIISLDSMQIYRFMDIGTAKATAQERDSVAHHLIDIVDPDDHYDAKKFTNDALLAISEIHSRNKIPILTGGTGLYLKSLTEGLFHDVGKSPQVRKKLRKRLVEEGCSKLHDELRSIDRNSAKRIHVNDIHRVVRALEIYHATGITWSDHLAKQGNVKPQERFKNLLQIGLSCQREFLYERINLRTQQMVASGLKEEVEGLLAKGYDRNLKSMQSIGYRHMIGHLLDNWSLRETEKLLARDTRRYAKRQYTWFRKMNIQWYERAEHEMISHRISSFLE